MRNSTTLRQTRPTRRTGILLGALTAAAIVLVPATPASAHHGWDGFDTDHLVYLSGSVSSAGSWGEPHSLFDIELDPDLPTDTPDLGIPEQLQAPEDRTRVEAAVAYSGGRDGLQIIIAPPAFSSGWGLDRALRVGERFQGVGYINRTDEGQFRPVAFWYGNDATPVNQVLGNTLPVRAPLPGSASDDGAVAAAPQRSDAGTGAWAAFGAIVMAAIIGGAVYLRRRSRQG